jgi:branched-chain amino acid transport system ATP-binding protein
MSNDVIFEAVNLRKQFGALAAVDDVSIQVRGGSLHAIIGPNGAGKTTLFNLLSGNLKPTSGGPFKGRDITHQPVHRTIHFGIGRSFQITNIFPSLSVFENIRSGRAGDGRTTSSSGNRRRISNPTKRARGRSSRRWG